MYIRNHQLITERLTLKSIEESSKEDFIKIFTNEKVKETYMIPDFKDEMEKETFFYRLKAVSENRDRFVYAIYLKERIIGFLNEVSKKGDTMEVGYFIDPKYWNKGYASEALEASIQELFKIGINHVKAAYFEGNDASKRVMEKCHMKLIEEEEYILYHNVNHRCIYYQIDNPDVIY